MSDAATTDPGQNDEAVPVPDLHAVPGVPETPAEEAERTMPLKIAILGDVELRVDVILGRARRTLQDLVGIRPGQTIELDRQRNSPVEVLVNDKAFALGEIVVIDETNLGVRILDILDAGVSNPGRMA